MHKSISSLTELIAASDFFAIAVENYKREDYQGAVDAFRKSVAFKEDWNSYNGLGWSLFKTNQFTEAIYAFRKGLSIQEHWNLFKGLGWVLFNNSQFADAIDTFRHSIALKDDWSSFQGLGWSLFKTNQFVEAVDAFRHSIVLNENHNSYHGLGLALSKTSEHMEAIDIFRKSLGYKEDWNSYNGLGWALFNINKFAEAIDVFRKSLALQKDWNSYYGLAESLFHAGQIEDVNDIFQNQLALEKDWNLSYSLSSEPFNKNQFTEAVGAYRKSLAIHSKQFKHELVGAYEKLADAYRKSGNVNASHRAWEMHFSSAKPISCIDPFLGNGGVYEQVDNEYLDQLIGTCSVNGFNFIPSFEGSSNQCLDSWKYLMYLHIPKCGGTSFDYPLHYVYRHLLSYQLQASNLPSTSRCLSAGSLISDSHVAALANHISLNSPNDLTSVFLTTHGVTWSNLHQHISKVVHSCPRIVTTVRDPAQRLMSHIRHLAAHRCYSVEDLIELVEQKESDFDNSMYRHIYDRGLSGDKYKLHPQRRSDTTKSVDHIDFIDIGDTSTISKVKSAYLTSSMLPNIVQYSRLNYHKDREKSQACNLSNGEIDRAFRLCVDKGFLEMDESINYDFLKSRTLDRMHLPSCGNYCNPGIHPWTFVVFKDYSYTLCLTSKFLCDPECVLQRLDS